MTDSSFMMTLSAVSNVGELDGERLVVVDFDCMMVLNDNLRRHRLRLGEDRRSCRASFQFEGSVDD